MISMTCTFKKINSLPACPPEYVDSLSLMQLLYGLPHLLLGDWFFELRVRLLQVELLDPRISIANVVSFTLQL